MALNGLYLTLMILFFLTAMAMVLIILAQRPSGGGLAAAFGGAGGSGGDTVFGGRVGDALTWATVVGFVLYLALALGLNVIPVNKQAEEGPPVAACCLPDGTCQDSSEMDCTTAGGAWQGEETDCATFTCPEAELPDELLDMEIGDGAEESEADSGADDTPMDETSTTTDGTATGEEEATDSDDDSAE